MAWNRPRSILVIACGFHSERWATRIAWIFSSPIFPSFGEEAERGILSKFPEEKQTSETALLFLELIISGVMRGIGQPLPSLAIVSIALL